MVHRVAVLTSGGDAPGMNAAFRAVVRASLEEGFQIFGVLDGYKGLVNNEIFQVDRSFVSETINRGGTILRTARLNEFTDPKVREVAIRNLRARRIDTLIVIGGNGTFAGGQALANDGFTVIGIPGTIDNDINCTDFTIGYDTCMNTIVESIDKIRDTSSSHQRCSIIEVMGRHCGDLAVNCGFGSGAEIICSSERPLSFEEMARRVNEMKLAGKRHAIIVVSEHVLDVHDLAKYIESVVGIESRATVLGHIQRGGAPSAFDRVLASRMGVCAVDAMVNNLGSGCICSLKNDIVFLPMEEAMSMGRKVNTRLYEEAERIK